MGSILFGVLISGVMYNDDVRDHGSGNAGMTNVLRTYGKLPACLPPLATLAKAWPPSTWDASSSMPLSGTGAAWQNPLGTLSSGAYLAAIFCMIGHSRPIFFGQGRQGGVLVGAGAAFGY